MGEHRPFRLARRSGGVNNRRQISLTQGRDAALALGAVLRGILLHWRLERVRSLRSWCANDDDLLQVGKVGAHGKTISNRFCPVTMRTRAPESRRMYSTWGAGNVA